MILGFLSLVFSAVAIALIGRRTDELDRRLTELEAYTRKNLTPEP